MCHVKAQRQQGDAFRVTRTGVDMRTVVLILISLCFNACAIEEPLSATPEYGPANVDVSDAPTWLAWRTESAARLWAPGEFVTGAAGIPVRETDGTANGARVLRNELGTIFVTEDATACEIARMLAIVEYAEDRTPTACGD